MKFAITTLTAIRKNPPCSIGKSLRADSLIQRHPKPGQENTRFDLDHTCNRKTHIDRNDGDERKHSILQGMILEYLEGA